ncbi:MAG: GNAT family N-acetyltransferase [Bacteroidetes bacterium]|nr:MAG: GNAT family N-acetyltransferase [Bacteroidota bacterium]
MSFEIERASEDQVREIFQIANLTWPVAFGEILSKAQLEYMLRMMYSEDVLKEQMQRGHEFYLVSERGSYLAFMGIEPNYKGSKLLKIHKLYVLPNQQGKGIGELLLELAESRGKELEQSGLTLNVNRFNKAKSFYEKLNFQCVKEEDIDIGQGYLMEDYVMEKHF